MKLGEYYLKMDWNERAIIYDFTLDFLIHFLLKLIRKILYFYIKSILFI